MKLKLLMSTAALALALGAATAGAQTTTDPAKRDQSISQDRNGNPVRAIDTKRPGDTTAQTPATPPTSTSTSTTPSGSTATPNDPSTTTNQPAASTNQPSTAQSGQAAPSPQPSTAQSTTPSTTPNAAGSNATNTNQPTAAQNTQPSTQQPPAQQPSTASGTAPVQPNAAQPATNQATNTNAQQVPVKLSASLQGEQKAKLTQAFTTVDMKPVTNVNFSLTVGSVVPRTVEFRPLPASVVSIIPQYRGYNYVLVRNEIVIIEPGTSRIVDVIERQPSQTRTTTTNERKVNLSKQQRDYIREQSTRRTTSTTTGAAPRTTTRRVVVGDPVPDTVEIETFPEEVYREVPTVRSYRYIRGERGIYLVDPQRRVIIDDLDD